MAAAEREETAALAKFCAERCADTLFLSTAADVAPYVTDWRGKFHGEAVGVALPGTVDDVAALVAWCLERGLQMVPQGGNTGLCGGSVPIGNGREVVVALKRLARVRDVDLDNATMTVEAGCTLQSIQELAAEHSCLFPLSFAAEGSAQIGGVLSTNAGGTAVLHYGNARALVLGIEAVLPDGRVYDGLSGLRKDNTGYDLRDLIVGAEGTLGIVTAATLRLLPREAATATSIAAVADPTRALVLLQLLRACCGNRLTGFEVFGRDNVAMVLAHRDDLRDPFPAPQPWYVLVELADVDADADVSGRLESVLGEALEAGCVLDATIAASDSQAESFWSLREAVSESQMLAGFVLKHDISVPIGRIPEFLDRVGWAVEAVEAGTDIAPFGHFGDGNIHLNMRPPAGRDPAVAEETIARAVYKTVALFGGSISAEHGIGQLKVDELARYKDPAAYAALVSIKRAFDPSNLMNPGKMFPTYSRYSSNQETGDT